eukprot:scaffold133259_cov112-Phaeocystis_antarctica.AAC.3
MCTLSSVSRLDARRYAWASRARIRWKASEKKPEEPCRQTRKGWKSASSMKSRTPMHLVQASKRGAATSRAVLWWPSPSSPACGRRACSAYQKKCSRTTCAS